MELVANIAGFLNDAGKIGAIAALWFWYERQRAGGYSPPFIEVAQWLGTWGLLIMGATSVPDNVIRGDAFWLAFDAICICFALYQMRGPRLYL
jgi:hypothetical protein